MAYEPKKEFVPYPDAGTLRASASKKTPMSPDYWGDIAINLKDMTNIKTENGLTVIQLSGWKKAGKDGKTYLSLSVKRLAPEQKGEAYSRQPIRQEDDFGDDSIPF